MRNQFGATPDAAVIASMRNLLIAPLTVLGSAHPERDEIEHLVAFCLAALGAGDP